MPKMIHHERINVEGGGEEDAYDVIEDDDGFNVVRDGYYMTPFDTLEEALATAYELAEAEERYIEERKRKVKQASRKREEGR